MVIRHGQDQSDLRAPLDYEIPSPQPKTKLSLVDAMFAVLIVGVVMLVLYFNRHPLI